MRHVGLALKEAGIPFCAIEVRHGNLFSQNDLSMHKWMSRRPLYSINLFCQNGWETRRFLLSQGRGFNDGRYAIGLWPWELPRWPHAWARAYDHVDEIWGISSHTTDAYTSFHGPIRCMGLPVSVEDDATIARGALGLPESAYLFHFSFDLHSRTARKNPLSLIRAFQRAFPAETQEKVGLVLKVNHAKRLHADNIRIRWLAARDPRIHLIERPMRRPEVLALMNACDCYVSLHRAEGFGRGIAEAILLGKQVIATGWSGNTDFCREPRVALVRHKMIPLKRGEYFHGEGQEWAEPDLDHAAELMREIRYNPRDVTQGYPDLSPASVGARYAQRIREIYETHAQTRDSERPDFEDHHKHISLVS